MHSALRTAAIITTLILIAAAGPTAASDWFGVTVSNRGVSLGFGSSGWGLWGSSWSSGSWNLSFDTALDGYGEWLYVNGLGRVWRPWVAADWRPYRYGRWVWTATGWTWVAYEPWGWMPHHYGNWAMTSFGWVWSPGYTYHPGSVVWVRSGGYVGWYPSAPHGWSHARRGGHAAWHDGYRSGYTDGWRDARYATWVPWSKMGSDNLADVTVSYTVATRGVARKAVVASVAAPSRIEVERHTGRPVPTARVVERSATIDGRQVKVVRPEDQAARVRRYGDSTVERALEPRAASRTRPVSTARPQPETVTRGAATTRGPVPRSPSAARRTAGNRGSESTGRTIRTPSTSPAPLKTTPPSVNRAPRQQDRSTAAQPRSAVRSPAVGRAPVERPQQRSSAAARPNSRPTHAAPSRSTSAHPVRTVDRPSRTAPSRPPSASAARSKSKPQQHAAPAGKTGTSRSRGRD